MLPAERRVVRALRRRCRSRSRSALGAISELLVAGDLGAEAHAAVAHDAALAVEQRSRRRAERASPCAASPRRSAASPARSLKVLSCSGHSPPLSQTGQSSGWLASRNSSTRVLRRDARSVARVRPSCPRPRASCRPACSFGILSISTRHIRQAPTAGLSRGGSRRPGSRRRPWSAARTSSVPLRHDDLASVDLEADGVVLGGGAHDAAPAAAGAWRLGYSDRTAATRGTGSRPGATCSSNSSRKRFTTRAPAIAIEVAERRTGTCPRSCRRAAAGAGRPRRGGRCPPRCGAASSTSHGAPSRQGVHLPQTHGGRTPPYAGAICTMQVRRRPCTITAPEPAIVPAAASASIVELAVEALGGRAPAPRRRPG